jgi:hypothetical protein
MRHGVSGTCIATLQVNSKSTWAFNLVPLAFPALTTLELDVDGVRLREPVVALLQQCRTLSSLSICGYTLDDEGTPAIAAAVAQLSSLRDLTLLPADYYEDLSPALIAAAVSSLTALRLPADCGNHFQEGTLTAVAHNPGLKTLRIHAIQEYPTAAQLAQLLAAVPSLTELDMPETLLDDQGVEAVLTHGSNITSLNVLSIKVETSFVDQPCNWQKLSVEDCYEQPSVLMLAHLPLRKVNDLHIWSSNLPELQLPLGRAPHAQLPAILRQAATNLASCPAWQAGFKGSISLTGGPGPALPNRVVFDGRQRIQLIKALAPLGSPALKQMQVSIDGAVFQWGRSEVRALARSLGGQVASLQLGDCTLQPDFWLALDECFPALTFLRLQQDVTCSPPDAALFCGARPADRPFTLSLHNEVYVDINGQQLRGSLAARGVAHVKVMRAPRT